MMQDFAFVPIQVLFVTLILDRLLKRREKQSLINKLNMVIGVFFHETGFDLIEHFVNLTINKEEILTSMKISPKWNELNFRKAHNSLSLTEDSIRVDPEKLEKIKNFLNTKRKGLLNLLANPNLLEHERFTDLLWAVFHLSDELYHRADFKNSSETDIMHLKGDILRAYRLIAVEWLSYMVHLQNEYPHLYSIATRTNPFNPESEISFPVYSNQ